MTPSLAPNSRKLSAPRRAKRTIITPPSGARNARRLIWLPDAPAIQQSRQEFPDLLALNRPVAAPAPPPRRFVPPPAEKPAAVPAVLIDSTPEVKLNPSLPVDSRPPLEAGVPAAPPKPPPKRYVPPAGKEQARETRLIPAAPDVPAPFSSASASVAVIGLKPVDVVPPAPPQAAEPAMIAVTPNPRRGTPAAGPAEGLQVPGLEVTSKPAGASKAASGKGPEKGGNRPLLVGKTFFSNEDFINARRAVRSLPLEARRVPPHIATAFPNRASYLFVMDPPNPVNYSGSWFFWYAEIAPLPGDDPRMQPPVPFRGIDPASLDSRTPRAYKGKVQLTAIIRKTGFVDNVRIHSGVDDRIDEAARDALRRWTFQPALRSGIMVDVDVLVEIPFDLRPPGAAASQ